MGRAARLLGVHPNTIRAWSDLGRLRAYRINDRGDRRYRVSELERFLIAAETGSVERPNQDRARRSKRSLPAPPPGIDVPAGHRGSTATDTGGTPSSDELRHRLRQSEALRRIAGDLLGRLDVADTAQAIVRHARLLFGADRVAVVMGSPPGVAPPVADGFSAPYLDWARGQPCDEAGLAGPDEAPVVITPPGDPGFEAARAVAAREGLGSLCVVPIRDEQAAVGHLHVGHDRPYKWSAADLDALAALASDAGRAIRTARAVERTASWAAQLQSIQALGARLSPLTRVPEIGHAIATTLRELIDYHNVRVYRLVGDELLPVAMLGRVGEYVDETPDQLRVGLGEGITGWVARHRVPELLNDAAADPRVLTIPGTEEDLPESMIVAPMVLEDECLGALVLSRLGTDQFTPDDLRLLVIYASFAAQAMAHADATELLRARSAALARRLRAQRELLRISESLLTTLDPSAVLEQITARLGSLIDCDNIAIEVVDPADGSLVPLTARGVHAADYLEPWQPGETGLATWVMAHRQPALVQDERADPRVNQFQSTGPVDGSLIAVPLLGPMGAAGVLTLERLGVERRFDEDEFELVQLFAAQVSIALRNAEAHRAVERRARTDALTGLLNHGTFTERLVRAVAAGEPFSLVMIDLDRFKVVNDTLGHQAGDRALRGIGRAVLGAARETDAVFRYGGDEFVLILLRTDLGGARGVAERVLAAVETAGATEIAGQGAVTGLSASIGIASYPGHGRTADEVLLAADRACFVAKRAGRARIATADEGLALGAAFTPTPPTPVDPPEGEAAPPAAPGAAWADGAPGWQATGSSA